MQMPTLDGFELLKRLQANPQLVLVTGHEEYARRAIDLRVVHYVMKPVTERLTQTLDNLKARLGRPRSGAARRVVGALEEYRAVRRPSSTLSGSVLIGAWAASG